MLELGIKGKEEDIVSNSNIATNVGSGKVKVFSTPMMIALMEKTAALSVESYLDNGQSTVGTLVNVSHLASSPLGMKVWAESKLVAIDRRKLVFEVEAYDERGLIGKGMHERFIIDIAKFQEKTDNK